MDNASVVDILTKGERIAHPLAESLKALLALNTALQLVERTGESEIEEFTLTGLLTMIDQEGAELDRLLSTAWARLDRLMPLLAGLASNARFFNGEEAAGRRELEDLLRGIDIPRE